MLLQFTVIIAAVWLFNPQSHVKWITKDISSPPLYQWFTL